MPPVSAPRDIESLSRDELLELVTQLVAQNEQLRELIARQQKQIDELTRAGKRQAAPFSKGTHKQDRKRPGRKPGQGPFTHREAPTPDEITEPDVDAPVTDEACPKCGGELESERSDFAYQTEMPEIPKPVVTRYRIEVCRCLSCGARVRGRHPEVAEDQYGATAHRVGKRVMATAHWLHYGVGVPMRKVPAILEGISGVRLTQSAIQQDAHRRTEGEVGVHYRALRAGVKDSERVNTDDSGWRVGGESAQIMVFETDEATVYQIRDQHRNEEVREVIPGDYAGVMGTDRGRSYDAKAFDGVKQQKCIGHIQRSITEVLKTKRGGACVFGQRLKRVLKEAVELRRAWVEGRATNFEAQAERLKAETTHHLRDRSLKDPDNQRLLDELGRHHDRGNLLRFLDDPSIDATNNAAERALRPAVIARKVSHCSKNERGARAYEAFKSVTQTFKKRGESVIEGLVSLFRSAEVQDVPP